MHSKYILVANCLIYGIIPIPHLWTKIHHILQNNFDNINDIYTVIGLNILQIMRVAFLPPLCGQCQK